MKHWKIQELINISDAESKLKLLIDDYEFQLSIRTQFPFAPKVFELSNIIYPKNETRHINCDESFCMGMVSDVSYNFYENMGGDISLYIENYIVPFLQDQLFYDDYGYFRNGEYDHQVDGIYQYYSELLCVSDINLATIRMLLAQYKTGEYPQYFKCLCRSGKNYNQCECFNNSQRRETHLHYHNLNVPSYLEEYLENRSSIIKA